MASELETFFHHSTKMHRAAYYFVDEHLLFIDILGCLEEILTHDASYYGHQLRGYLSQSMPFLSCFLFLTN